MECRGVLKKKSVLRDKVDDTCYMMLSIFSINVETLKIGLSRPKSFEIPGTIPLMISNQYWDTEKIPKGWKTSATVPALLQG